MIVSIYKELIQFEQIGGDMIERIKGLGVYNVFKPMAEDERFVDKMDDFNVVLWWVLYCYSLNSGKDIVGSDWQYRKLTIAKELKMPADLMNKVIALEIPGLRKTIINYLEFQDYRVYKHLKILQEQYSQMLSASLQDLKIGEGDNIDYTMKYKCGEYADKLLERIKFYEDKLKDDNRDLKEAITEIEQKERRTLGATLSADANDVID